VAATDAVRKLIRQPLITAWSLIWANFLHPQSSIVADSKVVADESANPLDPKIYLHGATSRERMLGRFGNKLGEVFVRQEGYA
jgi:hypothetical protein